MCSSLCVELCCIVCCIPALTSLRTLALDGNTVSSLAPLAGLTGLEVLQVATNQLRDCAGIQVSSTTLQQQGEQFYCRCMTDMPSSLLLCMPLLLQ